MFEEQFKKGVVTSYGMDKQYVNTAPQSMRCFAATYPDGESVNKFAGAIAANFEKVGKDFQDALASTNASKPARQGTITRIPVTVLELTPEAISLLAA